MDTQINTAVPFVRRPIKFILSNVIELLKARGLIWRLFVRNLKAKYRKTLLGYFGAILPPLVITLLWTTLKQTQLIEFKETVAPYPIFFLSGYILWQLFADAVRTPLSALNASRGMLTRIHLPKDAIVIAALGEVIFNFLIKWTLLCMVILLFSNYPSYALFYLMPAASGLLILGTAFGFILVPAGLLYQEVSRYLPMLLQGAFFLTPIIYPPATNGPAKLLALFNPINQFISSARNQLFQTNEHTHFILTLCFSITLLAFSWLLTSIAMPHLIERMEA